MFTGLIEELGRIERKRSSRRILELLIGAERVLEDLAQGSSIAVNGVCLTVTHLQPSHFSVDVSEETQKTTTLPLLRVGEWVNLERAISPQDRLGGHLSTGHIDGITRITAKKKLSSGVIYEIELSPEFAPYLVERGSVVVDGVSLTVLKLNPKSFSVNIVPYTQQSTTFGFKRVGDKVNIELDIIGKYVVNFLKLKQEFNR